MPHYDSVLDCIGNTPIVPVNCFDTGCCQLYLKLESMNPTASIKDRIALYMVEQAEQSGQLKQGGRLVEATAGNTGLALAMVAAQKGYALTLVIPDKMSQEKIEHLQACGAEVVVTRSDVPKGHPQHYQDLAEKIARDNENSFYINQFGNQANPEAHYQKTGPEIWAQMGDSLDAFVCGVGTGGTLNGVGRYLKEKKAAIDIILADPEGSILAEYIKTNIIPSEAGAWLVEGIGEDYIPDTCELKHVHEAYTISDKEAFVSIHTLLQKTGIFAGSSSGVLIQAAVLYCQKQTTPKNVLTFVCDSGSKYLSKAYNQAWLKEKGLIDG